MTPLRVLILEDNSARVAAFRRLYPGAVITDSAETCIDWLRHRNWDIVFLDHDLDGRSFVDPAEPNTGSAVVRWVLQEGARVGRFVVHSLHDRAARMMTDNLNRAGYRAFYIPGSWQSIAEMGGVHDQTCKHPV